MSKCTKQLVCFCASGLAEEYRTLLRARYSDSNAERIGEILIAASCSEELNLLIREVDQELTQGCSSDDNYWQQQGDLLNNYLDSIDRSVRS